MTLLLSLAIRNLTRNVRRTLITSVAVIFGVAVSIIGWGLVEGLDENALRAARTTATADVLLRPDGYPDDGMDLPLDKSVAVAPELAARLDAAGAWTSRVAFTGRIVKGMDATRVVGWAYDPARESQVFPRDRWRIDGAWPEPGSPTPGIVAGSGFARLMSLKAGDEVVLQARTRDGAQNALAFTVTGVVTSDNAALDNTAIWVPMDAASTLLALDGQRTHLAVSLSRTSPEAAAASLGGLGWYPRTTREEVADLLAVNDIRRRALGLLVFIVMAIGGTGIANTVIMSVYERVREIGTLLALGLKKREVRALFLLEGALMGTVSGVVGAMLGALVVLHYEREGIDFGARLAEQAGSAAVSTLLFTKLDPAALVASLIFGVGVSVLASLWPAFHAASLHPADAVRAD